MLTIKILEKKYSNKLILENAKISIDTFGVYGIVGKNGQGKTTLFRCVMGLEDYSGAATFYGNKISLQNVAWCPTDPKVYNELTAKEFYEFYHHLLDTKFQKSEPLFDVPNDKLIKEFSTGMKKKTYLNAIFQKKYELYILDEPFNGLDLESNYILMNYIREVSKTSIVLVSSHILELLYKHCKSIFLIQNKQIRYFDRQHFSTIEDELFQK